MQQMMIQPVPASGEQGIGEGGGGGGFGPKKKLTKEEEEMLAIIKGASRGQDPGIGSPLHGDSSAGSGEATLPPSFERGGGDGGGGGSAPSGDMSNSTSPDGAALLKAFEAKNMKTGSSTGKTGELPSIPKPPVESEEAPAACEAGSGKLDHKPSAPPRSPAPKPSKRKLVVPVKEAVDGTGKGGAAAGDGALLPPASGPFPAADSLEQGSEGGSERGSVDDAAEAVISKPKRQESLDALVAAANAAASKPPLVVAPPVELLPDEDFEKEILTRLAALSAALVAGGVADKQSEAYMEGKDVVKVVHLIASEPLPPRMFPFRRQVLFMHADTLVGALGDVADLAFSVASPEPLAGDRDERGNGSGGIDIQLLMVCIAALMALFRLPELCREVGQATLRKLWAVTCGRLLDKRLATKHGPYALHSQAIFKALNKVW